VAEPAWTVIVDRDGDVFVSRCPELDIASQGDTAEQSLENLREAVELFLESADPAEIAQRLSR